MNNRIFVVDGDDNACTSLKFKLKDELCTVERITGEAMIQFVQDQAGDFSMLVTSLKVPHHPGASEGRQAAKGPQGVLMAESIEDLRELLDGVEKAGVVWKNKEKVPSSDSAVTPLFTERGTGNKLYLVPPLGSEFPQMESSYTELKKKWCDSFEKNYLIITLNRNSGNVSAAAREAKLDRSNFLRLLRRHGLHAQEYKKAA